MNEFLARLRAALQAVEISANEADLLGLQEKGFLDRLPAFEQLVAQHDASTVPDYLRASEQPSPPTEPLVLPQTQQSDTIGAVAPAIARREISPRELVDGALNAIAARDHELNVFQLVLADEARQAARQAESAIVNGNYRGPLHGIPIALKDLYDLAGTPTLAGSRLRSTAPVTNDSTVATRLRAAGAIIIGKTKMSEFAYSPGSNNAHYGPTGNPFAPDRDSGGSSSGSAVAVATNMAFAGLGSDTGGSIRIPAAHCGLVGLKPTFGRVSLAGAVPLSWSLDHGGPLTRSVGDAALLLSILAGPDGRDPRVPLAAAFGANLTTEMPPLKIAILSEDGSGRALASPPLLAALAMAGEALREAGAELREVAIPELEAIRTVQGAILAIEAAAFHLPNLQTRLDTYGEFMRQRILAAFAYRTGDLVRAQQARSRLRERCLQRLAGVDLLCLPVVPDLAPPLGTPTPTVFTGPFNSLGWPALSLPVGIDAVSGLPLSVQLVAKPWAEATLLRAAAALEAQLAPNPN